MCSSPCQIFVCVWRKKYVLAVELWWKRQYINYSRNVLTFFWEFVSWTMIQEGSALWRHFVVVPSTGMVGNQVYQRWRGALIQVTSSLWTHKRPKTQKLSGSRHPLLPLRTCLGIYRYQTSVQDLLELVSRCFLGWPCDRPWEYFFSTD